MNPCETPSSRSFRDKETPALPIHEIVLVHLAKLPMLHRDPYDRMIVAQALDFDLTLLTADDTVRAYPVKLLSPVQSCGRFAPAKWHVPPLAFLLTRQEFPRDRRGGRNY